jgi:hypothetical protein
MVAFAPHRIAIHPSPIFGSCGTWSKGEVWLHRNAAEGGAKQPTSGRGSHRPSTLVGEGQADRRSDRVRGRRLHTFILSVY